MVDYQRQKGPRHFPFLRPQCNICGEHISSWDKVISRKKTSSYLPPLGPVLFCEFSGC